MLNYSKRFTDDILSLKISLIKTVKFFFSDLPPRKIAAFEKLDRGPRSTNNDSFTTPLIKKVTTTKVMKFTTPNVKKVITTPKVNSWISSTVKHGGRKDNRKRTPHTTRHKLDQESRSTHNESKVTTPQNKKVTTPKVRKITTPKVTKVTTTPLFTASVVSTVNPRGHEEKRKRNKKLNKSGAGSKKQRPSKAPTKLHRRKKSVKRQITTTVTSFFVS